MSPCICMRALVRAKTFFDRVAMENFAIRIDENVRLRLYKICRLCGDDNPTNSDILANNKKAPVVDPDFHKKIFECVGIQVTKGDKMPQTACNSCREKINDFSEFREMCLATDIQTRRLLGLTEAVVPKPDPILDPIEDDKTEVEKSINKKKNPVAAKSTNASKSVNKSKGGRPVKLERRAAVEVKKSTAEFKKQPPDIKKPVKLERDKQISKVKKKVQITTNDNPSVVNKKLKVEQDKVLKAKKRKAPGDLLTEKPPNKRERLRETIIRKSKNPNIALDTAATNVYCTICNNAFLNAGDLHRHLDAAHVPRVVSYHCVNCNESIEKKQDVRDHNLWHKLSKTPFECGRCKKLIYSLAVYTKHILNCSLFVQDFEYKTKTCPLCNQNFETQNLYNWHNCIISQLKCEVCQQKFSKKNAMLKHIVRCTAVSLSTSLPVVDSALEPEAASEPEPDPLPMDDHFADANDSGSDTEMNLKPNLEIDIEVPRKERPRRGRNSTPFVVIPTGLSNADIRASSSETSAESTPLTVTPPNSSSASTQEGDEDSSNPLVANIGLPMVQIKFEPRNSRTEGSKDGEKPAGNVEQSASLRVKSEIMDPSYNALYDPNVCRNVKKETVSAVTEDNNPNIEQSDISNPTSPRPMTPPSPGGMSSPDTPPPTPSSPTASSATPTSPTASSATSDTVAGLTPKPVLRLVIKKTHGTLNSSFVEGSDVPREDGEPEPKKKKKKKSKIFKIPKGLAMRIKQEKVDNSDCASGNEKRNPVEEGAPPNLPVISGVVSGALDLNKQNENEVSGPNVIPGIRIKQERLDDYEESPRVVLPVISEVMSRSSESNIDNMEIPAIVIKQERLNDDELASSNVSAVHVEQADDRLPVISNVSEKSRKQNPRKNKNHTRINPLNVAVSIKREPLDNDVIILEDSADESRGDVNAKDITSTSKKKSKDVNTKNINPFNTAHSSLLPVRVKQERVDDGYQLTGVNRLQEAGNENNIVNTTLERANEEDDRPNHIGNVRIKQEPVDDSLSDHAEEAAPLPVISDIRSTTELAMSLETSVDPLVGPILHNSEHTETDNAGNAGTTLRISSISCGRDVIENVSIDKTAEKQDKAKKSFPKLRIRSEFSLFNFSDNTIETPTPSGSAENDATIAGSVDELRIKSEPIDRDSTYDIPIKAEPLDFESDQVESSINEHDYRDGAGSSDPLDHRHLESFDRFPAIKAEPYFDEHEGNYDATNPEMTDPTSIDPEVNAASTNLIISRIESFGSTETNVRDDAQTNAESDREAPALLESTEVEKSVENDREEPELLVAMDRTFDDRNSSPFEDHDDEDARSEEEAHDFVVCKEEPISDNEDENYMSDVDQSDDEVGEMNKGEGQTSSQSEMDNGLETQSATIKDCQENEEKNEMEDKCEEEQLQGNESCLEIEKPECSSDGGKADEMDGNSEGCRLLEPCMEEEELSDITKSQSNPSGDSFIQTDKSVCNEADARIEDSNVCSEISNLAVCEQRDSEVAGGIPKIHDPIEPTITENTDAGVEINIPYTESSLLKPSCSNYDEQTRRIEEQPDIEPEACTSQSNLNSVSDGNDVDDIDEDELLASPSASHEDQMQAEPLEDPNEEDILSDSIVHEISKDVASEADCNQKLNDLIKDNDNLQGLFENEMSKNCDIVVDDGASNATCQRSSSHNVDLSSPDSYPEVPGVSSFTQESTVNDLLPSDDGANATCQRSSSHNADLSSPDIYPEVPGVSSFTQESIVNDLLPSDDGANVACQRSSSHNADLSSPDRYPEVPGVSSFTQESTVNDLLPSDDGANATCQRSSSHNADLSSPDIYPEVPGVSSFTQESIVNDLLPSDDGANVACQRSSSHNADLSSPDRYPEVSGVSSFTQESIVNDLLPSDDGANVACQHSSSHNADLSSSDRYPEVPGVSSFTQDLLPSDDGANATCQRSSSHNADLSSSDRYPEVPGVYQESTVNDILPSINQNESEPQQEAKSQNSPSDSDATAVNLPASSVSQEPLVSPTNILGESSSQDPSISTIAISPSYACATSSTFTSTSESTAVSLSISNSQLEMPIISAPRSDLDASFPPNPPHLNMLHINEIAENNNNANIERELQNDLDSISSNSNLDIDDGTVASLSEVSENSMSTNDNNRNDTTSN